MSSADPNKAISLRFISFPQNLLIPHVDNTLSFEATNSFNEDEKFKFEFEGDNLLFEIPNELESEIKFGPRAVKNFSIKLIPSSDGYGKLSIIIYWLKAVKYTVKVKKVRDAVPKSRIDEILDVNQIKILELNDSFNKEDYIGSTDQKDIKYAEKQLGLKRKVFNEYSLLKKAWDERKIHGDPGPEPLMEVSIEEINSDVKQLAKLYLVNKNLIRALELALEISDEVDKIDFYYNLIRAYSSIDLDGTMQILKSLKDNPKKNELIKKIAFGLLKIEPEQAPKIAYLIRDPSTKQSLLTEIIIRTINIDTEAAIKISQLIEDELLKVKILLNIVKFFHERNNKPNAIKLINQIIKIMEKSTKLDFSVNNYNNHGYNYYRDTLYILAEIDSPKAVDSIILDFNLRELKDKIAQDLFDAFYKMVDEIKTKFEPNLVFSQYYLFNTLITNINDDIINFSLKGGNISSNIILKDLNFNLLLVSLFSYNFTIFPVIDRLYSDLKFNLKKPIGYYIFPSVENHNEIEIKTINNTLKQLISSNLEETGDKLIIFNLDFIPYLGKPTIILSTEPILYEELSLKVNGSLGGSVNLMNNDSLFKGGKTTDNLKQIFSPNYIKIINLILSYEFINDYNILKNFIIALT